MIAALLIASGVSSGQPATATDNSHGVAATRSHEPVLGPVRIYPALEGGDVGWETAELKADGASGAACCGLITHEAQTSSSSRGPHSKGWWTATVLAAPDVAFVSVGGRKPVPTHSGGLPYGLRYVLLRIRDLNSKPLAFNLAGQRIDVRGFQTMPKRHEFEGPFAPKRWHAPVSPPRGACQISASGVAGLTAQRGVVISRVKGYRSLGSPAFQSCASTLYSLDGNSLNSAILLDAEHPGSRPAALPYMKSIPGASGFVEAPGGYGAPRGHYGAPGGYLTAERVTGAWLVVAGGSGRAERLKLLRHLHATIHV